MENKQIHDLVKEGVRPLVRVVTDYINDHGTWEKGMNGIIS